MGGVWWNSNANEVRKNHKLKKQLQKQITNNNENNDEINQRVTTNNNLMSEENIIEQVAMKNVKMIEREPSEEKDCVNFDQDEEIKVQRASDSRSKKSFHNRSSKYKSKDVDSVIDDSSFIRSKHK